MTAAAEVTDLAHAIQARNAVRRARFARLHQKLMQMPEPPDQEVHAIDRVVRTHPSSVAAGDLPMALIDEALDATRRARRRDAVEEYIAMSVAAAGIIYFSVRILAPIIGRAI